MFLINIPIIQARQRLVGPTGSETGDGESSPADPSGQGLPGNACSTPASSWAAGAAPALGPQGCGWALLSRARLWGAGPTLLQSHWDGNDSPRRAGTVSWATGRVAHV